MAETMANPASETAPLHDDGDGVRRRDFIEIAAVSTAGIGAAATLWPLITQMSPSADVLAESSTELDVSTIEAGQAIKAVFRKQPLFVRRLTPAEIAEADAVAPASLRDPQTLAERTAEGHKDMLITMGVCTHLGCVPLGAAEGENKGEYGGYSVRATVRTTTQRLGSAKGRPRPTCWCRITLSHPIPRLLSVDDRRNTKRG